MCLAIQQIHAQCGHVRTIEITEPCSLYSNNPSGNLCTTKTISTKSISEPPRCSGCCRRVERNIIKAYEIRYAEDEAQLVLLTREMRAEMDGEKRREMRKEMSGLVEKMGDLKDRRNEEVAEVRFRQGVGGGG